MADAAVEGRIEMLDEWRCWMRDDAVKDSS